MLLLTVVLLKKAMKPPNHHTIHKKIVTRILGNATTKDRRPSCSNCCLHLTGNIFFFIFQTLFRFGTDF